jgi:hypothetical protein
MDAAALAGMVIACLVVVGVLGALLYFRFARKKKSPMTDSTSVSGTDRSAPRPSAPAADTPQALHTMFQLAGSSLRG